MGMKTVGFFLITLGIFTALAASYPLFNIENTEINKKQVIGMVSQNSTEFTETGEPFWWLVKGINNFTFVNSSDEKISGNIILDFEPNPCKDDLTIIARNNLESYQVNINRETLNSLEFSLILGPREKVSVLLDVVNKSDCLVENGDNRNFGPKLIFWRYV